MRKTFATMFCLLLVSASALGQAKADRDVKRLQQAQKVKMYGGVSCGSDPILPTDGSSTQDYVGYNPNFYLVHLQAGHSYAAEMWDPIDISIGGGAQLVLLSSTSCTALPTSNYVSVDPSLSNDFADRISWIQSTNSDAVLEVNNLDPTGAFYSYVIRITDTTLQGSYWTTNGNLATQFVFTNNTQQLLWGTLTVTDYTAGGTRYTANVSIHYGNQMIEVVAASGIASPGLLVPANHIGRAMFAFKGPAGGLTAEGYTITSVNVPIAPIKLEPKFSPH